MKYRAVIFDLYGVLGLNGWQLFKAKHFKDNHEAWEPLRRLGQQVDAGRATSKEFVAAIAEATGETEALVDYELYHTAVNNELFSFIESELKNYKIGLLSNASHDVTEQLFSGSQLGLFDAMVLSASVGYTKPEQVMFDEIAKRLGVANKECVFVDDQERHLAAAERYGMAPIHFRTTEETIANLRGTLGL